MKLTRRLLPTLMTGLALLAAAIVAPPPSWGAAPRQVTEYIEAFNAGEAAMRAYLLANISAADLAKRPIDERMGVYREIKADQGRLTLERVVEEAGDHVRVFATSESGMRLDMTFLFGPAPSHHLEGLRIDNVDSRDAEPQPESSAPKLSEGDAIAAWKARLDSLSQADEFSGTALLAKGDAILFQASYGLASREQKIPNRADTRFNLGSINKIFTKLAIGQLVEQGKIKLDDPIGRYLTDYPKAVASKVTVRQLLDHRGGVPDVFGPRWEQADHSKIRTVADWIALFRDEPLRFEPGTRREYSNGGYVLLGAIVEKVSGEDYYDYVRRHIYEPLGMMDTEHYANDQKAARFASGYTRRADGRAAGGEWRNNGPSRPMRGSPAGGGYSTSADLLRFTKGLRASKLLRPETVRDGFGELGANEKGEAGLGIGGGAPGINAAVEMMGPYTIIVLANLDPPAAERAAATLRRSLGDGRERRGKRIGAGGHGHSSRVVEAGAGEAMAGVTLGAPRREVTSGAGDAGGEPLAMSEAPAESGGPVRMVRGGGEGPKHTTIPARGVDVPMGRSLHLPVVEVRLNGKGPYRFAIDTGAGGMARIDSALAASLGLEVIGRVRGGDPSGKNPQTSDLVAIGSLELGGATFDGVTAGVRLDGRMRSENLVGILGFALFKEGLLTLDYPGQRVRFDRGELPPADGKDVIDYTDHHGIASVKLRVDSLWVDADVDAGSPGGFSLPARLEQRLPLASAPRVVGRGRTLGNEFEIRAAELAGTVTLGGHEFPHTMVEFQPVFPMANVGSRVLKGFRVTFDQKNRRMRLLRAS